MSQTKPLSTAFVDGKNAKLVIEQAEIQVTSGPDRGLKIALAADSLIVGSSPQCDVVIHDGTVSARHVEIKSTTRGYFICDLESTNGIYCGSIPIRSAPLFDGMQVHLGHTTLSVKALGSRLSVPLSEAGQFGNLVARSVKMRAFVAALEKIADSSITALVEGETGSGKELVAEALHAWSPRRKAPFVTFDCAGITPSLAAATLFGHEKGAFTGANEARPGLLEEADGGTLFVDEVGELPSDLQPLLLGVIERKRGRRIGGTKDVRYDVRLIAATNRNLAEEVRAKRFRQDLFYRLAVARLRVPPLRERKEDIRILADQFAREAGGSLAPESLTPFLSYDWPGNVRELKNTVIRMVAQVGNANTDDRAAAPHAVSPSLLDSNGQFRPIAELRRSATAKIEKEYLKAVLAHADNQFSEAAALAGITRQSFTELLQKHGLYRAKWTRSQDDG